MKPTLQRNYFDELYAKDPDPWHFATKPYELQKYATTLEHLPRNHYGDALELGCSIGVLSEMLGYVSDDLVAVDAAQVALDQAQDRCAGRPHIHFERATLPNDFPVGQFDLVMMSEVGYYFDLADLTVLGEEILGALKPGGDLVMVHYLPFVPDYPLTGDEVHEFFQALPGLERLESFRADRYRFDSFRRAAGAPIFH